METRQITWYGDEEAECRASDFGDGRVVITGLGVPFNRWSVDLGGFKERIHPKAADESVAQDDLRVMSNHDSNLILGRKSAGTARFAVTKRGVEFEADRPDTSWARDLEVSIRRGDVRENSFGFVVLEQGEEWKRDGDELKRTVKLMQLREMGPQPFPAYPSSSVHVRSLKKTLESGLEVLVENGEFQAMEAREWLHWVMEKRANARKRRLTRAGIWR